MLLIFRLYQRGAAISIPILLMKQPRHRILNNLLKIIELVSSKVKDLSPGVRCIG